MTRDSCVHVTVFGPAYSHTLLQKEFRSFSSGAPVVASGSNAQADSAASGHGSGVADAVARLQAAHDDGLCVLLPPLRIIMIIVAMIMTASPTTAYVFCIACASHDSLTRRPSPTAAASLPQCPTWRHSCATQIPTSVFLKRSAQNCTRRLSLPTCIIVTLSSSLITNSLAKIPTQIDDRHAQVTEKHEDLKRHITCAPLPTSPSPAHAQLTSGFSFRETVPASAASATVGSNLLPIFGATTLPPPPFALAYMSRVVTLGALQAV